MPRLLETVAESDEALLEKYLGGEDLTTAEIKAAIRKMTVASEPVPGPVWLGVQEPWCAAHARRGHRLPARSGRRARHQGCRRQGRVH
nr:hypothetical protein [Demequina litorisediminis]